MNKSCENTVCPKQPRFDYAGASAGGKFCAKHRLDGMVNVRDHSNTQSAGVMLLNNISSAVVDENSWEEVHDHNHGSHEHDHTSGRSENHVSGSLHGSDDHGHDHGHNHSHE